LFLENNVCIITKILTFLTIKVSHGSVETQLKCGGMFNNSTATCPQSVPVKKF